MPDEQNPLEAFKVTAPQASSLVGGNMSKFDPNPKWEKQKRKISVDSNCFKPFFFIF
ncbi:hypothetical protein GCM10011364_10370 [Mangrovimonas yunxiaonensis]|nr:hypothetical protein GCM10011364_10370 [Mangrovimonas yunxiaonensis]